MRLFLHTPEKIRIINDAVSPSEFECAPAQWAFLEPDYPALPDGATGRYWTPERQYATDGLHEIADTFDGSVYCDQVAGYTPPCIWADIAVSQDRVRIDDADDHIDFSAALKDDSGAIIPVDQSWIIRLRDAAQDEVDAFEVAFTQGQTGSLAYRPHATIPPGRIHVDDADFHPVDVPGLGMYDVKLLTPVELTIYRQL